MANVNAMLYLLSFLLKFRKCLYIVFCVSRFLLSTKNIQKKSLQLKPPTPANSIKSNEMIIGIFEKSGMGLLLFF